MPPAGAGDKMAKKGKADKKNKSGKKKDQLKEQVEALPLELGPAVAQAARSMRTALSHQLAAHGLYAGQDGVIQALAGEDGLTPGALAQKLGVKAPTMTRTIGRMEAQGFVERRAGAGDARLTQVHLTETGRASLAAINTAVDECNRIATKGLSGKEVRALVKLLATIDENLHG